MADNNDLYEHQLKLAKVNSRKEAFAKSPFWFTFWDISYRIAGLVFWIIFWIIIAQWNCECLWSVKP